MFQPPTFRHYAPDPDNVHDVHSIYFEIMGEQGFIGFGLFILLGLIDLVEGQRNYQAMQERIPSRNGRPIWLP